MIQVHSSYLLSGISISPVVDVGGQESHLTEGSKDDHRHSHLPVQLEVVPLHDVEQQQTHPQVLVKV